MKIDNSSLLEAGANCSCTQATNFTMGSCISNCSIKDQDMRDPAMLLMCGEELPDEEWEMVEQYRWWIIGVFSSVVAFLGLIGNILSLVVLSKRSMSNIFNQLLSCLCCADLLFLLSNLFIHPIHLGFTNQVTSQAFPILEGGCHFAYSASIFLTVSINFERWQAVCLPHYHQEKTSRYSSRCIIFSHVLPVIIAALLFNITRFIAISSVGPELQKIPAYLKFLLFFQAFHPLTTTGLAPFLILLVLNYKIHAQMTLSRKFFRPGSSRTKEFRLARTMMALVITFLVLNMPRLVLCLIEVLYLPTVEKCYEKEYHFNAGRVTYIADFVARFLVILNSSMNFIIYCLMGTEFRNRLWETLHITNCQAQRTSRQVGAKTGGSVDELGAGRTQQLLLCEDTGDTNGSCLAGDTVVETHV